MNVNNDGKKIELENVLLNKISSNMLTLEKIQNN